jgi:hypothetical protein
MERNVSLKGNSCSVSQVIPYLSWNLKVFCHIHKNLLLIIMLSHRNRVHNIPAHLVRSISILVFHLCLGLPHNSSFLGLLSEILNQFLKLCPFHLSWSDHPHITLPCEIITVISGNIHPTLNDTRFLKS